MTQPARVQLDLNPLENLRGTAVRKAVRIGTNRAAAPVKASVVTHAEAIARYGFLAKSQRIRLKVYPGSVAAVVGPSRRFSRLDKRKISRGPNKGTRRKSWPAHYAHLVVLGTKRSKKKDYLTPSLDESKEKFFVDLKREVWKEIEAVLPKPK